MNGMYTTLSLRYSQAFMNVFGSSIVSTDVNALEACAQFFAEKTGLTFFLNISLIALDNKKRVLNDICERYKLSAPYNKMCMLLITHQRAILIPMVLRMIKDNYMKSKEIHIFSVTSSCELSEDQRRDIEEFLQKKLSGTISCSYEIDKTLIAGVRVTNGTLLWEHSIKKRLIKFKNALRR